jgi:hypothetical protein
MIKDDERVVDGTTYKKSTSGRIIAILEQSRLSRKRLILVYGDVATGKPWESATPERGHVGRSTGTSKIPLLIRTKRSMGGEAILDHCIIQIRESKGGRVLYGPTTLPTI